MPNYLLLAEHSDDDILEDLVDFWRWFKTNLTSFVNSKSPVPITLDFDRLVVPGESAGGYMAVQSALTTPKGLIKAMLLQYPMPCSLGCQLKVLKSSINISHPLRAG
ncbi:hypothetical protein K469DRAFT_699407 [Zopfia rhizophila CBS 207.26]|uniref:Alpha/beta hydrolase fold-3 domain-containing protein n=1 Tax=Zopfia rhizophila CBS 207.26 TaxID=1314779 RepID=A0A6A6EY83_9PEZI|nr:hypothetical protein K469DRAFT_699407 [Zopfia rhizophila CBS 207.26]